MKLTLTQFLHRKYKKEINHLQDEGKDEDEFLKNVDATANYKALLMVRNLCIILEVDLESGQPLGTKL